MATLRSKLSTLLPNESCRHRYRASRIRAPARRACCLRRSAAANDLDRYLLGVATIIAEFVAVSLDPQLAKQGGIPPLYLFLVSFIGGVYWFVCIYRYHVILAIVTGRKYPISPARAVGFHFIPFYQFYWVFKWPIEIARFVNFRLRQNDAADAGGCRCAWRDCSPSV